MLGVDLSGLLYLRSSWCSSASSADTRHSSMVTLQARCLSRASSASWWILPCSLWNLRTAQEPVQHLVWAPSTSSTGWMVSPSFLRSFCDLFVRFAFAYWDFFARPGAHQGCAVTKGACVSSGPGSLHQQCWLDGEPILLVFCIQKIDLLGAGPP